MRTRFTIVALLLASLAGLPATAAAMPASSGGPTPKQIQAAISEASKSKALWATFNICNTKTHRNAIGIRAQTLGLGFRTQMSMSFQVKFWSAKRHRYRSIAGATTSIALGSAITGLHQGGVTFQFHRHAGLLAAAVSFTWTLNGKRLATLVRATSKGHPDADNGDPPHFSAGTCRIR